MTYHTTGFRKDQIVDLCALITAFHRTKECTPWPPIFGLFNSVVVTLTYLRRNRVQAEIAETFGVSQPTISRAINALVGVLGAVVAAHVPVAEDLDPQSQYIVDGSLLPCWCHGPISRLRLRGATNIAASLRHHAGLTDRPIKLLLTS